MTLKIKVSPYQFIEHYFPGNITQSVSRMLELAETATVTAVIANGRRPGAVRTHDLKKRILECFAGDPDGIRQLTAGFSVSYITVCRVFR